MQKYMKNLKEAAKKYFKKLLSDFHSAVVGVFVAALVLSAGGIYLFSKNLWALLKTITLSPTPLWGTAALALGVLLYIHLKSKAQNSSTAQQKRRYEIKFFTIGNYKWETRIYDSGYFEVEKYPYCVTHDLKFIFGSSGKYCPAENCSNRLSEYDEFQVYETAKSIIDKKVRNKEY
jgi:hypothetical protein